MPRADTVLAAILEDAARSRARWGEYQSLHEAYGVIAEEVAELLDAVRADDDDAAKAEAIQIAACCYKLARFGWHRTS